MKLFLLMFITTAIEVILIAKVGAAIGFVLTFLLILTTAAIGTYLLKQQGLSTLAKLNNPSAKTSDIITEGLILLISGVLLITPGFLTDTVGFLLLAPNIRSILLTQLKKHIHLFQRQKNNNQFFFYSHLKKDNHNQNTTIEGEYQIENEKKD